MVLLSHPYMTTGKTITWTRRIFVSKVISLPFSMLFRCVIAKRQSGIIDGLKCGHGGLFKRPSMSVFAHSAWSRSSDAEARQRPTGCVLGHGAVLWPTPSVQRTEKHCLVPAWTCAPDYDRERLLKKSDGDFHGSPVVKNLLANTGDTDWSPGLGRCHKLLHN